VTASNRRRWLAKGLCLFLTFLTTICVRSQEKPAGIQVRLSASKSLELRVTLRSLASTRVTVYKSDLPRSGMHNMLFIAVRPNGEYLNRNPVRGDPSGVEIVLHPGEAVSSDIDLAQVFPELDSGISKSDVHLFWAYRPPEGLGLPKWTGGWILLPQRKH